MSAREVFPGVTVDPEVCWGQPCVRGTGIMAAVIASRFAAGESTMDLKCDYRLKPKQVEAALRWELLSVYRKKRRMEGK